MTAEEHAENDMPDSVRELTETMRELRTRSGLTLAALAQRTDVSKSSWERYLNGKKFPPRTAVVAFTSAVGVKPDRLLLLWDLAARSRHRAAEREHPTDQTTDVHQNQGAGAGGRHEEAPPRNGASSAPHNFSGTTDAKGGKWSGELPRILRSRRAAVAAVVACGLLLGSLSLLRGGDDTGQTPTHVAESGPGKCLGFECTGKDPSKQQCDTGAWTAGLSEMSGSWVELRYSPSCRAAWARITLAKVGDSARVINIQNEDTEERAISFDRDVYSPMVEAPFPGAVRACGVKPQERGEPEVHCTEPGASAPVEWPTSSPSTGPDPRDSDEDADDQGGDDAEAADQEKARRGENEPSPQAS